MEKKEFIVTGMTCSACERAVTKAVQGTEGVEKVEVNLLTGKMIVEFNATQTSVEKICDAVKNAGYDAEIKGKVENSKLSNDWEKSKQSKQLNTKNMAKILSVSIVVLVLLLYVSMGKMIGLPQFAFFENPMIFSLYQLILSTIILVLNKNFFVRGFKSLKKLSPNMDALVSIGSLSAYLYSLVLTFLIASNLGKFNLETAHSLAHSLYYESAATILTLVSLGKFFETLSKQKTTSALDKLIKLSPKSATILKDGKEQIVDADLIAVGDVVVIRAGDVLPSDGEIVDGFGYLDQSAITGESMPVKREIGEKVISASVCVDGSFKFKATKVGENTTLSEIIKLVEDAGNSKAPISRIADKVSGIFVPVVILISLLSLIVWLVAGKGFEFALTRMISVLVISCPCALGLATPVAIMVATGRSANLGILVKSAEALETLHKVDVLIFDKTGTITTGKPIVTDIVNFDSASSEKLILELAKLEQGSNHPLALAIKLKASEINGECNEKIDELKNVSGSGISAKVNGKVWLAGNLQFVAKNIKNLDEKYQNLKNIIENFQSQGKSIVIFVKEKSVQGVVAIADEIREKSAEVIQNLKSKSIKTVLLSGDSKLVADYVGKQIGADEVISDVFPADKESLVKNFQSQKKVVAMVGDGINDSPALTRADVGIAVGTGTDIAIESADIVLTSGKLSSCVDAINLSKATMRNIKVNLFWAFFYNSLGIPLAAGVFFPLFGWNLNPMIAALAMSLSSVCVVLNALSLNFFGRIKNAKNDKNIIKNSKNKEKFMKKVIYIDGMMCNHCVSHVSEALKKVEGVVNVQTSLEEKRAVVTVNEDVSDDELKNAVVSAGYEVKKID